MIEKMLEKFEELKVNDVCIGILCSECEKRYGKNCDKAQQSLTIDKCKAIVKEVAKEYGWIPVEVAMPENGERVLTTDHLNNYHLFRVLEGVFVDECCQIINENHQRYYPPVAWQRITPYQKGE